MHVGQTLKYQNYLNNRHLCQSCFNSVHRNLGSSTLANTFNYIRVYSQCCFTAIAQNLNNGQSDNTNKSHDLECQASPLLRSHLQLEGIIVPILRRFGNLRNDYFGKCGSSFSGTLYWQLSLCQRMNCSFSGSPFILRQPKFVEVHRRICTIKPSHLQYQKKECNKQ